MITSIGEILVDIFIDNNQKTVIPGGAPFNLACNISSFGGKVFFYGAIGNDEEGKLLTNFINSKHISTRIDILQNRQTTEALVELINGERSFKFVRDLGADYCLNVSNIQNESILNSNIIHLGSLMLSKRKGRIFFFEACEYIHNNLKAKLSFDVNYRDDIFTSEDEAKKIFVEAIKQADIIKFTSEELELLSGEKDIRSALKSLLNEKQIAVVTLGEEGSIFYSNNKYIHVPTFKLKPVDTTGAGDAFYSYFLYELDKGLDINNDDEIISCLTKANVVGGLATQKKGAIDVVPTLEEIHNFLNNN